MIETKHADNKDALSTSLIAKAEAMGEAFGSNLLAMGARDPGRWRNSRLLWPLFGLNASEGR